MQVSLHFSLLAQFIGTQFHLVFDNNLPDFSSFCCYFTFLIHKLHSFVPFLSFFLMRLNVCLFFYSLKGTFLSSLIAHIFSSISLICALIFIIFFLVLILGLDYSCFCRILTLIIGLFLQACSLFLTCVLKGYKLPSYNCFHCVSYIPACILWALSFNSKTFKICVWKSASFCFVC